MPSPFPGMDPFIECQQWEEFHFAWHHELRNVLVPKLRHRYVVHVERRVYPQRVGEDEPKTIVPDALVLERSAQDWKEAELHRSAAATLTMPAPVRCKLPRRYGKRETFLTIRKADTDRVVTVIATLSPENKRHGSTGRSKYMRKRGLILDSTTNLVEFDLLRAGRRLPMLDPLPAGDFYAIVSRRRAEEGDVYAWILRDRLPTIPIPLARGDSDVPVDLQAVFAKVYDHVAFDDMLDYRRSVEPAVSPAENDWIGTILQWPAEKPPTG